MGYIITGIIGCLFSIYGLIIGIKYWSPELANYVRARLIGFIGSAIVFILLSIYLIILGLDSLKWNLNVWLQ